jgi:hypothetical protein
MSRLLEKVKYYAPSTPKPLSPLKVKEWLLADAIIQCQQGK